MKSLITACFLMFALPAFADSRAEDMLAPLIASGLAPGVALIYHNRGHTGFAAAGERAQGSGVPVQADDLWHIGSNTKSMTATLVARLAEADRISLSATIGELLGSRLPDLDPGYADMGFADLLAHRAGVRANPSLWQMIALSGPAEDRDVVADRLKIAQTLLAKKPTGTAFLYSNAGYVIVGAMLEAATGESWETLVQSAVFAPLGMDGAGFGPPGTPGEVTQPRGHSARLFGGLKGMEPGPKADNIAAFGPAGRVHLNAEDMMRYLLVHLREDPGFLSQESWDWLHKPAEDAAYVAGWGAENGRLFHTGSNTFWYAFMGIDPGSDKALAIFANAAPLTKIDPVMEAMAHAFQESRVGE